MEETKQSPREHLTSFQKLENIVGKDVIDYILNEVKIGNITKLQAEEFAFNLHNHVGGNFRNLQGEVNFNYTFISMKQILSNWYEKEAFSLENFQATEKLKSAFKNIGMDSLAYELGKLVEDQNISA